MSRRIALTAGLITVGLAAAVILGMVGLTQAHGPTVAPQAASGPTYQWNPMTPTYGPQYGAPHGGGRMGGWGMMGGSHGGGMMGGPYGGGMGWGCPMAGGFAYSTSPAAPGAQPLTIDDALATAERYVASLGNPDLAIGEVEEYAQNFYVFFYEKSTGVGAFEMLIGKSTGAIHPEPGPNMMWNVKYGMMGDYGTPIVNMPVTRDQAVDIAQAYLEAYLPGAAAGEVHIFYGYYTIMVSLNGETYGMLSVNGYSGQVWYHTWHGAFIQEKEVE